MKNIGIVAHVDAGKTTITENFLYLAEAIKQPGSVDQGSSVTDSMQIEKERGISIRAASVAFSWNDNLINLVDTPGHSDFSSEVERSLAVLDGVILVLSAVEGVQSHTILLWEAIQKQGIPCVFFINKLDRDGADSQRVMEEIRSELKAPVLPISVSSDDAFYLSDEALEIYAEKDDEILEAYLAGESISWKDVESRIIDKVAQQRVIPLFQGIAKTGEGMSALLNALGLFIPEASKNNNEELSALVFKVEHDQSLGRLAHVRLFSGQINKRDQVLNHSRQIEEKVAQIKKRYTSKLVDIDMLESGDIGIVSGLTTVEAGDILGDPEPVPYLVSLQQALITIQVKPRDEKDYASLADALTLLNVEDPSLDFNWYKEEKELHLKLMGSIQIEVLQSILQERFGIAAEFEDPTVIYKETPQGTAVGFAEYTMPKPCWAVMEVRVERLEGRGRLEGRDSKLEGGGRLETRDSKVEFESVVSVDKIARKYQNEVRDTVPKALEQGIKGWEVIDIKVTLTGGEDHEIHSRPGDFILATPMGIMDALKNAGTQLLEPIYTFTIKAHESFLGEITSDISKMRGTFESPEFDGEQFTLKGKLPVSTSLQYHIRLSSLTGGKGRLFTQFGGYQPCSDEEGVIRDYKGVNPLNRSQWILHHRGAYKSDSRRY